MTTRFVARRIVFKIAPASQLAFATSQHKNTFPDTIDHSIYTNSQVLNGSEISLLGQRELYINKDADISIDPPIHPAALSGLLQIPHYHNPPKSKDQLAPTCKLPYRAGANKKNRERKKVWNFNANHKPLKLERNDQNSSNSGGERSREKTRCSTRRDNNASRGSSISR